MNVWNGGETYPEGRGPVVATIGNYDGVHVGHRRILDGVVRDAHRRGLPSLLITFDPHPLTVLRPEQRRRLLQTRRQKLDSLVACGVEDLLLLPFDERMAALSAEEFFANVLARVRFAAVHVGENFRFGRERRGNFEVLERIGGFAGFDVHRIEPVELDGRVISSTAIREAVEEGRVELARRMLDRPFGLDGVVVRGAGRGREMAFPTANLEVENELWPKPGVYVTEIEVLAARHASVTNIGVRPTFGGGKLMVETHLFDFEDDIYDERVQLKFLARIRDEMKFDGPSELGDQIARDRAAAHSYFENVQVGFQ